MSLPHILSVEDRKDCQDIIAAFLGDHYQITPAHSISEAVNYANNQDPDLILMDINLPDGTGYEACKYIFSQEKTLPPDVIFISSLSSLDDRLEAYRCGGSDYLAKPINAEELKTKVALALSNREKQKALSEQAKMATETAMTAMTNSGEQGALLSYSTQTFTCQNYPELAEVTFQLLQQFGLQSVIRMEALPSAQYFSANTLVKPLEQQLLDNAKHAQRILSRGNRTLFNDGQTTLLIKNMPIGNEALYGRLKDHVALICKILNARLNTLNLEFQSKQQRQAGAGHAVERIQEAMSSLDQNLLQVEAKLRHTIDDLLLIYEEELLSFGLSSDQEQRLLSPLADTKAQLTDLFDITETLEENMHTIEHEIMRVVKE